MHEVPISSLKPGERFHDGTRSGVLLYVNFCRARVRYDAPPKDVTFEVNGRAVHFTSTRGREDNIAPASPVVREG